MDININLDKIEKERNRIIEEFKQTDEVRVDNIDYILNGDRLIAVSSFKLKRDDLILYADVYFGDLYELRHCKRLIAPYLTDMQFTQEPTSYSHKKDRGLIEELYLPKMQSIPAYIFMNTNLRKANLHACESIYANAFSNTNLEEIDISNCDVFWSSCFARTRLKELEVHGEVEKDFVEHSGRLSRLVVNGKEITAEDGYELLSIGRVAGEESKFNNNLLNMDNPKEYLEALRTELLDIKDGTLLMNMEHKIYGNDGLVYTLDSENKVVLIDRWTEDLLPDKVLLIAEKIHVGLEILSDVEEIYAPFCEEYYIDTDCITPSDMYKILSSTTLRIRMPRCKEFLDLGHLSKVEFLEIGFDSVNVNMFQHLNLKELRVSKDCIVDSAVKYKVSRF